MQTRSVYIRFRGQTTGPFSQDEIKQMVQQGRVSRLHALSTDRVQWQRAGRLAKLYPDAVTTSGASSDEAMIDNLSHSTSAPTPQATTTAWYYAIDGSEVGPVKEQQVVRLIERGALKQRDLVWCEGMADWSPISDTPLADQPPS